MNGRTNIVVAVIAALAFGVVPLAAQHARTPARTPWGEPDFQGLWTT